MTPEPFTEKADPPTEDGVKEALGRSHSHWTALLAHLAETYPQVTETWRFFGGKMGHWTLRVMSRKRTSATCSRVSSFISSPCGSVNGRSGAQTAERGERVRRNPLESRRGAML